MGPTFLECFWIDMFGLPLVRPTAPVSWRARVWVGGIIVGFVLTIVSLGALLARLLEGGELTPHALFVGVFAVWVFSLFPLGMLFLGETMAPHERRHWSEIFSD